MEEEDDDDDDYKKMMGDDVHVHVDVHDDVHDDGDGDDDDGVHDDDEEMMMFVMTMMMTEFDSEVTTSHTIMASTATTVLLHTDVPTHYWHVDVPITCRRSDLQGSISRGPSDGVCGGRGAPEPNSQAGTHSGRGGDFLRGRNSGRTALHARRGIVPCGST